MEKWSRKMGVWRRNPKVESQETRMVLGSDNHMDCANICCQLVCHFSVIWWAILEWKYSMTYDCFRKLRLLYGYKSMEGKRWKGVRNEAGVAEGQWIWWGWYFLQLYLLAVLLSRMTPLMICLCLNIMTLRITSSATTTPTWPWPARAAPSSWASSTASSTTATGTSLAHWWLGSVCLSMFSYSTRDDFLYFWNQW